MITRTFTISSGAATPKTERRPCVIQGFPGTARIAANGARAMPNREMLAAPRMKASQTRPGEPGRSSAAMTSQSTSNAGAMAATPIDVGRAWSSSMSETVPRQALKWPQIQLFARKAERDSLSPRNPAQKSGLGGGFDADLAMEQRQPRQREQREAGAG